MLSLVIISISLGFVSAENLDDTNSTLVSIDENSQVNNENGISFDDINQEKSNNEVLKSNDEKEILGDSDLTIVGESKTYTTSDSIDIKLYSVMSFDEATVSVYLNGNVVKTVSYGEIKTSSSIPLINAKSGLNTIYCIVPGVFGDVKSNEITFTVTDGGSVTPIEEGSATISIYDIKYPSQSTISQNGNYVADIAYTIVKKGDGFSDENLEVIVNGHSIGSTTPNLSNRLGNITIDEDNEWKVTVVYSASVNGKTVTATSNELTYITKNTGNGNGSEPEEGSVTISIWDLNYPTQSKIIKNGDYVADIAYKITKNGDGFSDENLEVIVNGHSIGSTTPNLSNRLGNITIDEDNEWTVTVVYSANYNGKTIAVTSNQLIFITNNTSNGNGSGSSSTNGTEDNNESGNDNPTPQPGEIQVIIRDAEHPNDSQINLNEKYNVLIEYYVNVPEGSLLTNDLIIMCNGEPITTVNPISKTYTSIGGRILLNETGNYVFTAKYMYNVFMTELHGTVESNPLTYNVVLSQNPIEPTLSVTVSEAVYPNKVTAIVKSNIDGEYLITIGENTYNVVVSKGTGSVNFTLPAATYTANVVSKTNSSLKNSTSFTIYPKGKETPVVKSDVEIKGKKVVITLKFPEDINNEKVTVTLNGKTVKEATIDKGKATVEFDGLDDGDYSYKIYYPGNDDYSVVNNLRQFSIKSDSTTNGNSSSSGNESDSNTNQSAAVKTIVADDLKRSQNSPFDFKAIFYDKNGNPLSDSEVNFIINGNDNIVKTDEYGIAKLVKKLDVGVYEIEIKNLATGESTIKNLTVIKRIIGNRNINMDYSFSQNYKLRLFADNGNPVGAGEKVVVKLNGKSSTLITDKNGYVTYKISGLIPKTYTITAEYKGVKVSNKIIVKQILKAKNAKFKKSKKVKKFKVTLKTSKGKAISGKKITLKVKGKTYSAKTNKNGVATFKIKNLKKAGKFKATINYLKSSIKKSIIVRR